ncbi:LAMI_0C07140g1_1 [Lachancea mirantina]|uniref:LAMI_0C07140g1_1 n=1 Tax=Lachancea mirantina TaxID=1230905 RepID=A0A1G4J3X5_9SACH|nr:LAMI_0C07140g1_1 [Lachancea mirantina]
MRATRASFYICDAPLPTSPTLPLHRFDIICWAKSVTFESTPHCKPHVIPTMLLRNKGDLTSSFRCTLPSSSCYTLLPSSCYAMFHQFCFLGRFQARKKPKHSQSSHEAFGQASEGLRVGLDRPFAASRYPTCLAHQGIAPYSMWCTGFLSTVDPVDDA